MLKETAKHSRGILLAIIASTLILGSGMSAVYAQTALTVETDADSYQTGDTITITGRLTAGTINQPILIQILDPQGNRDRIDQIQPAADGSYSYSFTAGGLMNTNGEYRVLVTYNSLSEETTFQFTSTGQSQWRPIQAMIGGQSHTIYYMITGAGNRLDSVTGDVDTISLLASLTANSAGTLSLRFDEEIFHANNEEYVVFADGIFTEYDYEAYSATEDVLHIDFEAGTTEIEIVGDHIIPEFGAIAAIVLAVAIVGIIVATARTGKLGSFVRKDW